MWRRIDSIAPRVLTLPLLSAKLRQGKAKRMHEGNPVVPFDLVNRGYLTLWNRYKSSSSSPSERPSWLRHARQRRPSRHVGSWGT